MRNLDSKEINDWLEVLIKKFKNGHDDIGLRNLSEEQKIEFNKKTRKNLDEINI